MNGVRYFSCPPQHGVFVRPNALSVVEKAIEMGSISPIPTSSDTAAQHAANVFETSTEVTISFDGVAPSAAAGSTSPGPIGTTVPAAATPSTPASAFAPVTASVPVPIAAPVPPAPVATIAATPVSAAVQQQQHSEMESTGSPCVEFDSVFDDMPIPTDVNVVPFVTFPPLSRASGRRVSAVQQTVNPASLTPNTSTGSEDEREFARSE